MPSPKSSADHRRAGNGMRAALLLLSCTGAVAQSQQFMQFATRAKTSLLPHQINYEGYAIGGDLNGDGRNDLIATAESDAGVCLRSTTGGFAPSQVLDWWYQKPVLIDLDGDGDLDLVGVPRNLALALPVLVYDNVQSVMMPVTLPPWLEGTLARGAAVGDIDGDGFADLVLAAPSSLPVPSLVLARGGAGLQFTLDLTAMPAGLPLDLWPELLDADGDGDLDVLATNATSGLQLLRNVGGSFVDATSSLPPSRSGHTWLLHADLDGDGRTDCAARLGNGDIDVLWGAPAGFTFATAVATGVVRLYPADFDGDLDVDLLADTASGLDVLWNQGQRQFVRTSIVGQPTMLCGVADVDTDGISDVVFVVVTATSRVRCLYQARLEDAAFGLGLQPWMGAATIAAAADIDGDGRTDLVTRCTAQITVDHAAGGGAYRRSASPAFNQLTTGHSELADMDRDGDLDLVARDRSQVAIAWNDGTGTFAPLLQTAAVGFDGDDLRLADVTGDGEIDVVWADNRGAVLLRNRGGGQFDPPLVLVPATISRCVEVADVDGDGDLDVISDVATASGHVIAANDGTGTFAPGTAFAVNLGQAPTSVRAGDIDGDGDADLLAASFIPRLLRNNGNGVFTDTTSADLPFPPASVASNLVLADLDGDGDLDLGMLRNLANTCILLLNDGSGRFTDVSAARCAPFLTVTLSFGRWLLRAADIDDDGDVDLIAGAGAQFVFTNHLRHCTSRTPPRLGGVAELLLSSGPGFGAPGSALLGIGFDLAAPPLSIPGLTGQLELDPGLLQIVAAVPTSTIGVSSAFVAVPTDPLLYGLEVWFQGAILPATGQPGFTNAVYEVVLR